MKKQKRPPLTTRPAKRTRPAGSQRPARCLNRSSDDSGNGDCMGTADSGTADSGIGDSGIGDSGIGDSGIGEFNDENATTALTKPIKVSAFVHRRSQQAARELRAASLKEYAEAALLYFVTSGLDPRGELSRPDLVRQMAQLEKRVFTYLQGQEQAYLLPMFAQLTNTDQAMETSLSSLIGQLEKVYQLLYRIEQMVHVSTSTTLFVSGLPSGQIEDIKQKNKAYVESQLERFSRRMNQ